MKQNSKVSLIIPKLNEKSIKGNLKKTIEFQKIPKNTKTSQKNTKEFKGFSSTEKKKPHFT